MAQKLWFAQHINKDKQEYYDNIRELFMHIRPEWFVEKEETESANASNTLVEDLELQLGRGLTEEERAGLSQLSETPEVVFTDANIDDDIDIIERM